MRQGCAKDAPQIIGVKGSVVDEVATQRRLRELRNFQPCRERPLPVIELSDLAICLRLEYPRLRGLRKGLQIQSAHYPENHGQNQ